MFARYQYVIVDLLTRVRTRCERPLAIRLPLQQVSEGGEKVGRLVLRVVPGGPAPVPAGGLVKQTPEAQLTPGCVP